jgi:hypothetical protein
VESDFEAPKRRSGTLFADRAFDDRYRNIGRLLITCAGRFSSASNSTSPDG